MVLRQLTGLGTRTRRARRACHDGRYRRPGHVVVPCTADGPKYGPEPSDIHEMDHCRCAFGHGGSVACPGSARALRLRRLGEWSSGRRRPAPDALAIGMPARVSELYPRLPGLPVHAEGAGAPGQSGPRVRLDGPFSAFRPLASWIRGTPPELFRPPVDISPSAKSLPARSVWHPSGQVSSDALLHT